MLFFCCTGHASAAALLARTKSTKRMQLTAGCPCRCRIQPAAQKYHSLSVPESKPEIAKGSLVNLFLDDGTRRVGQVIDVHIKQQQAH